LPSFTNFSENPQGVQLSKCCFAATISAAMHRSVSQGKTDFCHLLSLECDTLGMMCIWSGNVRKLVDGGEKKWVDTLVSWLSEVSSGSVDSFK
jgi:hypothetical protein